jgi:hypothetical protein
LARHEGNTGRGIALNRAYVDADHCGRSVQSCSIAARDEDLRALSSESCRNPAPDTRATAGHDGDLSDELSHDVVTPFNRIAT